MGNEAQVSIVKRALDAELEVKKLSDTISKVKSVRFKPEPQKPKEFVKIERKYPEIKSSLSYWPYVIVALLLGPAGWIIAIIYYYAYFKNRVDRDKERIRLSPEYQSQVQELNQQYDSIDASEYQRYIAEKKEYDEVLIPNYMKEKTEWSQKRALAISKSQQQLDKAQEMLANIYESTKLIPSNYHNIAALTYIYNFMSTSQYDLKEAIDKYEQHEASIREQQFQSAMLQSQNEQAEAAWEARDLAEQSRNIAEKARREQNLANLVGAVQRHNTNKLLKK